VVRGWPRAGSGQAHRGTLARSRGHGHQHARGVRRRGGVEGDRRGRRRRNSAAAIAVPPDAVRPVERHVARAQQPGERRQTLHPLLLRLAECQLCQQHRCRRGAVVGELRPRLDGIAGPCMLCEHMRRQPGSVAGHRARPARDCRPHARSRSSPGPRLDRVHRQKVEEPAPPPCEAPIQSTKATRSSARPASLCSWSLPRPWTASVTVSKCNWHPPISLGRGCGSSSCGGALGELSGASRGCEASRLLKYKRSSYRAAWSLQSAYRATGPWARAARDRWRGATARGASCARRWMCRGRRSG